jgi:hypothetical protein
MALKQISKQHTTYKPINKQEHNRGKDLGFTDLRGKIDRQVRKHGCYSLFSGKARPPPPPSPYTSLNRLRRFVFINFFLSLLSILNAWEPKGEKRRAHARLYRDGWQVWGSRASQGLVRNDRSDRLEVKQQSHRHKDKEWVRWGLVAMGKEVMGLRESESKVRARRGRERSYRRKREKMSEWRI